MYHSQIAICYSIEWNNVLSARRENSVEKSIDGVYRAKHRQKDLSTVMQGG